MICSNCGEAVEVHNPHAISGACDLDEWNLARIIALTLDSSTYYGTPEAAREQRAEIIERYLRRAIAKAKAPAPFDSRLAEQWADTIAALLPSFANSDDFDAARKTIGEYVALILKEPGTFNGFSTRDAPGRR